MGIRPGTHHFFGTFDHLNEHWVSGKAFDNRVGCTVNVGIAEAYANATPPVELCLVGSVAKTLWAGVATFAVDPDMAIAMDVTHAFGAPASPEDIPVGLGKGPALAILEGGGWPHHQ